MFETKGCPPKQATYMKLVSEDLCFGPEPPLDTVVTQRLQVWADGQVRLERVTEGKQRRRWSFHVEPQTAQQVFTAVGKCFTSVGILIDATDEEEI